MKTIVALLILLPLFYFSQKDVTQFLDIPIDGSKTEMIKKLKEKGYAVSSSDPEVLSGEFNGAMVRIHVATNNNKVFRLMVVDDFQMNEGDIKIRFNNLCNQFKNNKKYSEIVADEYLIPEDEDISYMMSVKNKSYEALFYQKPALDSTTFNVELQKYISERYPEKQMNFTEKERQDIAAQYYTDKLSKKAVWFKINELYGKYYITLYYDNEYNRANGEDL